MGTMRFAVTTFQRVFDTRPNRDVVSLERLIRGLTHFLVKPKAQPVMEREIDRLEQAWEAWQSDRYVAGKYWSRLSKARQRAEAEGRDGTEGAVLELHHLRKEIAGAVKKDLRLWSPAHYPPDSRRGSENVLHLSSLVLDYDSGVAIGEAGELWAEYFHVIHTTWSHTREIPKFRLILPLAEPVLAQDWPAVYAWAEERTGFSIDPSNKGPGTTFALPAVPSADVVRVASSSPGPLLDARLEGLVSRIADPPEQGVVPHEPNHFRLPIPGHELVEGSSENREFDDPWQNGAEFPWS